MRKRIRKRMSLRMSLILFVFGIMMASIFVIGALTLIAVRVFGFEFFNGPSPRFMPIIAMFLFSVVVGTALTAVVGKRTLQPLKKVIDAMRSVAEGDFTVQVDNDESLPEIADLAASFNKMVRELSSIETLRSDFISNFSHEFKTPIVSVRGFAKLLREKDLPQAEREEYVEIIIAESERLANLATNILNLSRLENTGILTEKSQFFLDEQVRRVAATLEPRWREKSLKVGLELDSVTIRSDQDLLWQVWANLLDNAVKFTPPGGHINIRLRKDGQRAVFNLEDDGCGMDEAALAHLYDKFYQADASHTGGGSGLGLSMVRRVVSLCEGSIEVDSTPGRGSRFTVALPLG